MISSIKYNLGIKGKRKSMRDIANDNKGSHFKPRKPMIFKDKMSRADHDEFQENLKRKRAQSNIKLLFVVVIIIALLFFIVNSISKI